MTPSVAALGDTDPSDATVACAFLEANLASAATRSADQMNEDRYWLENQRLSPYSSIAAVSLQLPCAENAIVSYHRLRTVITAPFIC